MKTVIEMARDQGLPETEVAGVFIVNQDVLGMVEAMAPALHDSFLPPEIGHVKKSRSKESTK